MDIILVSIYAVLFIITSIFLLVYFKRLRSINLEYMRLKKAFEDIIFSFNRDLKKIEEKIHELVKRVEEGNNLSIELRGKMEDLISYKEKVTIDIEGLKREIERISAKYSEIERKMESLRETVGERKPRFYEERTAESTQHGFMEGDKALAYLTATELKVLEILAREGEKTVPEIRERIGLTREHTARLMKSLYERGYVERRTDKVPFTYRLAKGIEEIIKKKE